jgi:hypothetical protein
LGGEIFLSLQEGRDVVLELDEFASYGFRRARAHEAAAESAGNYGGTENGYVA